MGASSESEYLTVLAPEREQATTSSSVFVSSLDAQIERSKRHWSELAMPESSSTEEEVAVAMDNREVFKALQLHPTWGRFFIIFGDNEGFDYLSAGELEVGEKFAEGGQAELFHVHVTWLDAKRTQWDLKRGVEYVLKVFKKGTMLRQLQSQWPHGYLQWWAEHVEKWKFPAYKGEIRYNCQVLYGTLLEDGRFGFLMIKEHEDLRSLIDRQMLGSGHGCGPFSKEKTEEIMYGVALGMDWLHSCNIVHRDLKASNVLVREHADGNHAWLVADYECSIGVVGTEFWRAPEILQACKEGVANQRQDLFTTSADIYSYGMTCYETLTGKVPFEHHPLSEDRGLLRDLVISGLCPEVPEFVDDWIVDLLKRCWQTDPATRPSIQEVITLLEANSNSPYVRRMSPMECTLYHGLF